MYESLELLKVDIHKSTLYVRIMFVNDKTRATYKNCRRSPIRHGLFVSIKFTKF